jgi:arginyl-tRNA synthetase
VNSEQMRLFAESVRSLALGAPLPEGGYRGDYVQAVAESLRRQFGDGLAGLPPAELQKAAQRLMLDSQRSDLAAFGVEFDTWFSEQSLHDSGEVARQVEALEAAGAADSRPFRRKVELAKGGVVVGVESEPQPEDGRTLWLRSTKFGDDQDRVLRRSDGRLTYIASDVAYHADKLSRGTRPGPDGATGPADKLVTVLGPDHHGYVARLHAVVAAVLGGRPGADPGPLEGPDAELFDSPAERDACRQALEEARQRLEVVIFQLVRFVKDGEPAPMRKRDGNVYALIDLVREIGAHVRPGAPEAEQVAAGRDVARFFYLMRNHETTFDFDLDLAERESEENPVFYVQYAHARICGILRKAAEAGLEPDPDAEAPLEPSEAALLVKALDVAHDVARTAQDYAVNRLATAAQELARAFHPFYDSCRVIDPDEPARSRGRLATCEAVRAALQALLDLLGVSSPESMARAEA